MLFISFPVEYVLFMFMGQKFMSLTFILSVTGWFWSKIWQKSKFSLFLILASSRHLEILNFPGRVIVFTWLIWRFINFIVLMILCPFYLFILRQGIFSPPCFAVYSSFFINIVLHGGLFLYFTKATIVLLHIN